MAKLVDFKCRYADFEGITPESAAALGLKVPDLYFRAEDMVLLAKNIKKEKSSTFCKLPLDLCVEAENLGGKIKYDESPLGPRKLEDVVKDTEEVLDLPDLDPARGRMAEVLRACRLLSEEGETVALEVRGLFNILNSLMDIQKVFMTAAVKPDVMMKVCDKIREDLVTYILAAEKAGCRLFFYSDGSGGLNIIGPKYGKKITDWFTYPLIKELAGKLSPESLVHICPKTAFMLVGCDKAAWKKEDVLGDKDYLEAYLANPEVRFVGQRCSKDLNDAAGNRIYHLEIV